MRRNFDRLRDYAARYKPTSATVSDRRVIMRGILAILLIANLVALWLQSYGHVAEREQILLGGK